MSFGFARSGLLVVVATAAFMVSQASAATLTVTKGQVLVSDGGGYREAGNGEVAAGNTLLANPDAQATLTFSDGCVVNVEPGTVSVVPDVAPCQAAAPAEGGAGGLGGAAPYVIGLAALGGGAALIASAGSGSGSGNGDGGGGGNPASP